MYVLPPDPVREIGIVGTVVPARLVPVFDQVSSGDVSPGTPGARFDCEPGTPDGEEICGLG